MRTKNYCLSICSITVSGVSTHYLQKGSSFGRSSPTFLNNEGYYGDQQSQPSSKQCNLNLQTSGNPTSVDDRCQSIKCFRHNSLCGPGEADKVSATALAPSIIDHSKVVRVSLSLMVKPH